METCIVEQDGDDLVITLPDTIIEHLGVAEGDTLIWELNLDGSVRVYREDQ